MHYIKHNKLTQLIKIFILVAISNDLKYIASGGYDKLLKIWDLLDK